MTDPVSGRMHIQASQAPQGASFEIIEQGTMRRTESGQLHAQFTIRVPPGEGIEIPVTVMAATELHAFAQIAALAKQFDSCKKKKGKTKEWDHNLLKGRVELLQSRGWMQVAGGPERHRTWTRQTYWTVKVPLANPGEGPKYADVKIKGADLKAVEFYAKIFAMRGGKPGRLENAGGSMLVGRQNLLEEMEKPGPTNKLFDAINARGEPPTEENRAAIKEALQQVELTYPGITERIKGERTEEEMLNDIHSRRVSDEQMNSLNETQNANLNSHANYLKKDIYDPNVLDCLFSHKDISPKDFQALFPMPRAEALGDRSEVRQMFGGCEGHADRRPEDISGMLDAPMANTAFPNIRDKLGGDHEWQNNTMTYDQMMGALKTQYYDTATDGEKTVIQENVKYMLNRPEMTEEEVLEALTKTDGTSENCSFNLFAIAYEHRADKEILPKLYPNA